MEDCKKALIEKGYSGDDIKTGYYYNEKGDNDFKDCDILVLMGYPFPNPHGPYEEITALYEGASNQIRTDQQSNTDVSNLKNGNSVKVKELIFGFEDFRLHNLYLQKSRWEFYQAFHRSRVYLRGDDEEVIILAFTDVPVPDVVVEGFIGNHGVVFAALAVC